ncbi:OmpA family protein [Shewanella psychropiezotolerans]|uniref:OmpA family protein n=1 Tax=Shewanella psychropiezotolerans TaxID=2593655 RepID=A0ABX5X2V1_9GAMM|nr:MULTISPECIES: OmpA family protein [Shewanella]MPY23620.1 OmpA family protein [Shewanella sp. YLB-07]QDO85675.1 OmpA family protein [Shewanella psychropiezotolerans]
MKAIISIICLLFAGSAIAECKQYIHLTEIPYAKNSSYFPSKYAKQLDELIESTSSKPGYLLLEFQILKHQASDDNRKYNMWLANRRIDRIKQYLTNSHYPAPVISRILTASNEDLRDVSITWCHDAQSNSAAALAIAAQKDTSLLSINSEDDASNTSDPHEGTISGSR